MPTRKTLIACFLALFFLAVAAHAQEPAPVPPNAASASVPLGLLLARVSHQRGTEVLDSPSVVQYETLWIVRDASGAHIAAKLPDIIVPRKTGFWRIGIAHTCHLSPPSYESPKGPGTFGTEDIAYSVPVEQTPAVQLDDPDSKRCDAATAARVFADDYRLYDGDSPAPHDPTAPSQCGWQNIWFSSVLPDMISVSYHQGLSENCDSRGSNSFQKIWMQSPDDPLSAMNPTENYKLIPFERIFGADGRRAWNRAVTGGNSCLADAPAESLDDQTGWSLVHFSGKWMAYAFTQQGRECAAGGYVKVSVPRSVTHAAPLPFPWAELEKQVANILDAYVSPSNALLVVVVSKNDPHPTGSQVASVALYELSGNKLGAKLLDIPAGDVVMAEWATGRFVQSWTDSLSALQSRGLAPATVKAAVAAK
jgi:hypothetical protein